MEMDQELKNSILKTGTTILGIVCRDGIVMASDRQMTLGHSIVASKRFQKTHPVHDYLVMSYAGSASDAQRLVKLITAELKLKELRSKTRPTIRQAANLVSTINYSQIRQPSMMPSIVASLVGGINEDGSVELYSVGPDGTIEKVEDYDASLGSGLTYVLGLLERQYRPGMSVKEGVDLAVEAIKSSTQRDTGSGHGIDVFTITKDGIKKVVDQEILPEYRDKMEKTIKVAPEKK